MRSIAMTSLIAGTILTAGCNTIHGVGKDFSSLKEVVPHGSRQAAAATPAAPAADPVPNGTQ